MTSLEELIPTTQSLLQPLITKPKLTEKLLSKPPFRFLHDIVTNLMGRNNFAPGLYTNFEMDSKNVTEKQAKMDFLDKLIRCVGICQGEEINVRSLKIVAGAEPECTNALLIALAKSASDESLDTGEAALMALRGESPHMNKIPKLGKRETRADSIEESVPMTNIELSDEAKEEGKDSESSFLPKREIDHTGRISLDESKDSGVDTTNLNTASDIPVRSQSRVGKQSVQDDDMDNRSSRPQPPPGIDLEIEACSTEWQRTKELLDGIISKPKASEKLLSRPPFRFLHDLIMEVIRVTGFASGLFNEFESNSKNVTDKESKVAYLEKIIKMVGMSLNTIVDCRPNKVVAGLEAENTNRFLQLFILAATKCQHSSDYLVHTINNPDTPYPNSRKSSADERNLNTESKNELDDTFDRRNSTIVLEKNNLAESKNEDESKTQNENNIFRRKEQSDSMVTDNDRNNINSNSGEKRSIRPRTAKKRPPLIKENVQEIDAKEEATKLAQLGGTKPNVMIMREGTADEGSEEEDEGPELQDERLGNNLDSLDSGNKNHGKLVQDIMDQQKEEAKKKEQEDSVADGEQTRRKSSLSVDGGIRMGRLSGAGNTKSIMGKSAGMNGPALGSVEIQELKNIVQAVSKAAHPLGRCMEGFQDDISIMSKEYDSWANEYRQKMEALEEAKRITELELQPLRISLIEVEEQLKEQLSKVNGVKCAIAKNDDRIDQFLRMVVSGNKNEQSNSSFSTLK